MEAKGNYPFFLLKWNFFQPLMGHQNRPRLGRVPTVRPSPTPTRATTSYSLNRILRALAAASQPFSLSLRIQTTFCFPIQIYTTIKFLKPFLISLKYYFLL
jgi:hypothetical protein